MYIALMYFEHKQNGNTQCTLKYKEEFYELWTENVKKNIEIKDIYIGIHRKSCYESNKNRFLYHS